jgi:hypothetical protein
MARSKVKAFYLLLILLLGLLVRLIPLLNAIDWTDLYGRQALPILDHLNIYSSTKRVFPYSPVSMFLPAMCAIFSTALEIPFYIIMRLPAIFADICIGLSIYAVLAKLGKEKTAFLSGLLYVLNPVSILISSFHGNLMPVAVLFSFQAYTVLLDGEEDNYRLSALLLGLAIGFRGYPVLLLPLFLIKLRLPVSKKVKYVLYSTIPTALSFVPFLLLDYRAVFREVFSYTGFPDYGLGALLRAFYSLQNFDIFVNFPGGVLPRLLVYTKALFIVIYILILVFARRKRLVSLVLAVFLAFYCIYSGISSQYLIWILPFAFLAGDRLLKYYVIFAAWALVNFYSLYHPYIIFGRISMTNLPLVGLLKGQIISLGLLWLVCAVWLVFILSGKGRVAGRDLL